MKQPPALKVISFAIFSASVPSLVAQSNLHRLTTTAFIDSGHQDSGFAQQPTTFTSLPDGVRSSSTGDPIDLNSSADFGDMTFSGHATASANYGTLGTSADGLLENSVFQPYFSEDGPPSGPPNVFRVVSLATWKDTLTYQGPSAGYFSNFVFDLTGSIAGANAVTFVTLQHTNLQNDQTQTQQWSFSDVQDYDTQLVSDPFFSEGSAEITVTFQSFYQVFTSNLPNGTTTSGVADFSNTLVLDEIEVKDQSGVEQPETIITGASGTQYRGTSVPEPSTALLAFSGLFLLGCRRR